MECCPTMDLVAFVIAEQEILLYRISGQRVWSASLKERKSSQIKITCIVWKTDGQMLVSGSNDGIIRVCDVHNGKIVHRLSSERASFGSVCCVDWNAQSQSVENDEEGQFSIPDFLDILPKLRPILATSTPYGY